MQQSITTANTRFDAIKKILADYVRTFGSLNTTMHELRDAFAEIYPPSAPEFLFHWSTFARTAIAEDARRGRRTYPIGGTMAQDFDPGMGDPFILPGKTVFQGCKEVFRQALGRNFDQQRTDLRSPNISIVNSQEIPSQQISSKLGKKKAESSMGDEDDAGGEEKVASLLERLQPSEEGQSISHSYIPVSTIPNLRPHPRFSPPHGAFEKHVEFLDESRAKRGNSNTPSGTPPSSPELLSKKNSRISPPGSRMPPKDRVEQVRGIIHEPENISTKRAAQSDVGRDQREEKQIQADVVPLRTQG